MKLNKRYLRNVKENLSFYIAASVLTIMALWVFYIFHIAGTGIMEFSEAFFSEHNIEDANFTTYMEIPDGEISAIEEKFDVELEKQAYINLEEEDYTVRVFGNNNKVNTYELTEGNNVANDDEMIISEGYAQNMKVSVGDSLAVAGKEYKVVGYFQRPDYLYMLENVGDTYKNITSFFLAYFSENEFERLGETSYQYMIVYHVDNQEEFRKYIDENYITASYVSAEENSRISMVVSQPQSFLTLSWVMLIAISFVSVALIAIIIGRKVKRDQKILGTLAALGYGKWTLCRHYAILAIIPGVFGGVLSAILATILAQPYGEKGLMDYEPMRATFELPLVVAVAGGIVPVLMYMIVAVCKVLTLLKMDTVELLGGNADGGSKLKKIMVGKSGKVHTKFAFRSLLGNPSRSFVIFIGIFLGAFIILFGFVINDSVKEVMNVGINDLGDFEYEYVLNELQEEPLEEGEPLIFASYEKEGSTFTVIGSEQENPYMNYSLGSGEEADLSKGWYVTSLAAKIYDLEEGDSFTFTSITTLEEYKVEIAGVIDNSMQKALISSREEVADLLGWNLEIYNGIMSDKVVDLDENLIATTVTKQSFQEQCNTLLEEMELIFVTLSILGIVICVASVYLSVNIMVTENHHNISMLKVLGYRTREINRMVLNSNHILLPLGILISIPTVLYSCKYYFDSCADSDGMLISTVVSGKNIFLTVMIVSVCYFVSLLLLKRKVTKVDMVECLKDNRE